MPTTSFPPQGLQRNHPAPILRLGKAELLLVTRFISLRELASLYLTGNGEIVSRMSKLDLEARMVEYGPVISMVVIFDPFRLLSRFSRLHSVRLETLWYKPSSMVDRSPLIVLPPTLRHLELRWCHPKWIRPVELREGEKSIDEILVAGMHFKDAFPELVSLILITFQDAERKTSDFQSWTCTLPRSLTRLALSHKLAYQMAYTILLGCPDANPSLGSISDSTSSSFIPVNLPNLTSLELQKCLVPTIPLGFTFPSTLKHLRWPFFANEPHLLNSLHHLDSLHLNSMRLDLLENFNSLTFLSIERLTAGSLPVLPSLKTLRLKSVLVHCDTSDRTILHDLFDSGIKLTELQLEGILLPNDPSIELREMISSVFSSLTSLTISDCLPHKWWIFPRGLLYLHLFILPIDAVEVEEDSWRNLPQGLLHLDCSHITVEIGFIPLLPRSITELCIFPTNCKRFGTRFITPEMRTDGLPYDAIQPDMDLLFGLPPNLRKLHIHGYDSVVWHSTFGLFLPRTLRLVTGKSALMVAEQEGLLNRVASFIGRGESTEQLLKRTIDYFPSGCECTFLPQIPGSKPSYVRQHLSHVCSLISTADRNAW